MQNPISLFFVSIIASLAGLSNAQPSLIAYQGRVATAGGTPEQSNPAMEFSIFDSANGTTPVWGPQRFPEVPVVGGLFNVVLGPEDDPDNIPATPGRPLTGAFSGPNRWVEVKVNGTATLPRQQILSVPYAIHAERADVEPGSIGNLELADVSVTGPKIAANSVDSTKIKDGTLNGQDLALGAVSKRELAELKVLTARLTTTETLRVDLLNPYGMNQDHQLPGMTIVLPVSGTGRPVAVGYRRTKNANTAVEDAGNPVQAADIQVGLMGDSNITVLFGVKVLETNSTYTTRFTQSSIDVNTRITESLPLSSLNYIIDVPAGQTSITIQAFFRRRSSGTIEFFRIDPEVELFAYEL